MLSGLRNATSQLELQKELVHFCLKPIVVKKHGKQDFSHLYSKKFDLVHEFYFDLERKFQTEKKASPVDVDLFANMGRDDLHLDELEKINHKFRRCPNTVHALPSTGHAVIRTFLQFGATDTLMRMLHNKLDYGLFPNYYLSNLLMDTFLQKENYRDAVKVAIEMMLQEDFNHPIASQLALYSSYAYLKSPTPEPWDPQPVPPPEEPVEEVKVRVDYIREPFFDDHFDLTEPNALVGKTLAYLGKHFHKLDQSDGVAHTSRVLGWTMYGKHNNALDAMETVAKSKPAPLIFQSQFEICKEHIAAIKPESSEAEVLTEKMQRSLENLEQNYLNPQDIQEVLRSRVEKAVQDHGAQDIAEQTATYAQWEALRESEVRKQLEAKVTQERLKILETKKRELAEKEERLFFFDNLTQLELQMEEKEKERDELKALEASKKKKTVVEEDSYIPPEVHRKRS
nr:EOG090X05Q1 [Lepidurus arcticus]